MVHKLVSNCCGAEFYTVYSKDKDPQTACEECHKICTPVESGRVSTEKANDTTTEKAK